MTLGSNPKLIESSGKTLSEFSGIWIILSELRCHGDKCNKLHRQKLPILGSLCFYRNKWNCCYWLLQESVLPLPWWHFSGSQNILQIRGISLSPIYRWINWGREPWLNLRVRQCKRARIRPRYQSLDHPVEKESLLAASSLVGSPGATRSCWCQQEWRATNILL